ncbi:MAG: pirin family protein [Rhodospirillales bacterium]|nr:pirin family protein [Rhodospirillales bacterium]
MKPILGIYSTPDRHWVGDGFPVRTLFSYDRFGGRISPFLLLDYAGPAWFDPSPRPRGVGAHPHRGFETVTIVYDGEVAHRDSTGQGGVIGPGDVQWMTAGGGILHEEFHSPGFTRTGGPFRMVQLWVNLPARDKMTAPKYQAIRAADIPSVALPDGAGRVRVIAGAFAGTKGPAHTFTPMDVWDLRLVPDGAVSLDLADGGTGVLVVLSGSVTLHDGRTANEAEVVLFDRAGAGAAIRANGEATALVLAGEPIDEPIVGHGPFVMNSEAEIRQAITDFSSGRFMQMHPA